MKTNFNESLKGLTVLIDPHIHKKTKLDRNAFLEKVKHVETIRTQANCFFLTYYITSQVEYENLLKFHNMVNKGVFDFKNYHVFAVAIQPKLYNWFKTTTISTKQKQIVCWLASCIFFEPKKKGNF